VSPNHEASLVWFLKMWSMDQGLTTKGLGAELS
jgi:hypothetical protein